MDKEQPPKEKQHAPTPADYLIMKQAILEYRAREVGCQCPAGGFALAEA